jgi:hypothetical protein
VRREQLETDDAIEPGEIAGTQQHFPGSDPEHVATRPVGPIEPHEMEPISLVVSQADEAG